jgi:hypothetical protein
MQAAMFNISATTHTHFIKTLSFLLAAATLATMGSAMAAPGPLPDQEGNLVGLDDHKNEPVLVYVAKLHKVSESGNWEKALIKSYPQLKYIIVADIGKDTDKGEKTIEDVLRTVLPKKVVVSIDMQNEWAKEYKLDLSTMSLLLFNADHDLAAQFQGKVNSETLARVEAELAKLFPATPASAVPAKPAS